MAHVDRVAVLVPGADTGLDTHARFRRAARALHLKLRATAPAGTRTAVVAWLGYATPVLTTSVVDSVGGAAVGVLAARSSGHRDSPRPPFPRPGCKRLS
ncbi:alpha/beta hydrolase [Streptomyces albidoflavus]